jgi:uncharacterized membrane protein
VLALRPSLSLLGISVLGSGAHVLAQLGVIGTLFGAGPAVLSLAPVLLATAVPLGLFTGALVLAVDRRLTPW